MSAREDLINEVTWSLNQGDWLYQGDAYADAVKMVDAFAHELAEKIRNSKELRDLTDDHMGDCYAAADLIDPELNDA